MIALLAAIAGVVDPLGSQPRPDPLATGWNGECVCDLLQETEKPRMPRCTFVPGVGHERHYHAPRVGYILAGARNRETPAGATWKSGGIAWHEARNVGGTTAVHIIVESKAP